MLHRIKACLYQTVSVYSRICIIMTHTSSCQQLLLGRPESAGCRRYSSLIFRRDHLQYSKITLKCGAFNMPVNRMSQIHIIGPERRKKNFNTLEAKTQKKRNVPDERVTYILRFLLSDRWLIDSSSSLSHDIMPHARG